MRTLMPAVTIPPSLLAVAFAPAVSGQVVVNEIHYAPADETVREEFVELHNAGAVPVDLSGWQLSGAADYDFPAGTAIGAGEYLVVAQDPAALAARFGGVRALGPFAGRLSSDGETIVLRDPAGVRADEVDYRRGFPWPTAGGNRGYSIELLHPSLENDLGGSWRLSDAGAGEATTLVADRQVWRYRKGTSEASSPPDAWRAVDFDDSGWLEGQASIGYGEGFIATSLADMRGGYVSVFLRKRFDVADPSAVGRLTLEAQVDDGSNAWINGVHVVRHNLPSDEMPFDGAALSALEDLTFVAFDLPAPAGYLLPGENVIAVQLHNASLANSSDAFIDVRLVVDPAGAGPTPGARNAVYDENPPPQLRQVEHAPASPGSGMPVAVTVKATDPDGVAEVTLEYQVVSPGAYVRLTDPAYATGWTATSMRDDGAGADAEASDGVYSAEVPPSVHVHRRLVRYRIAARDATGRDVRVPYPDDPQPNFAYFVHDGVPSWRGASRPGATPVVSFGVEVTNLLPVYYLIAQEQDIVRSQYDGAYDGVHFLGTLVYEGAVYDHLELENRGEFSTYVSGKNKWRLHFQRGHELEPRDNHGRRYRSRWRTMNLSPCSTPWVPVNRGMAGLDEAVAFRLYELAGTLSPRTHYLHLRVIDEALEASATDQYRGDLWGLYLSQEHPDGAFLEERGLPDGNTYKIEGGNGDKKNQGPTQPRNASDYDAYRNGFNSAQPIAWWRANVDLEGYYAFRAVDRAVNNMDLRDGWNHCQYHNPETNRWTAIPWDLDMLYMPTTHWSGTINVQNSIVQHPALRIEYASRARELQDLLFTEDQAGTLVDELMSFVSPPGWDLTFADIDEAQWNYHPRTTSSHMGAFYRSPASQSFIGGTVTRTLVSKDHAGMARWIKDFVLAGYGAARLAEEAADAAAPDRPSIAYEGPPGYPADGLVFRSSAFSDPQGAGTFGAMQWRVAEVTPEGEPWDPSVPRRYEVEPSWTSPVTTTFDPVLRVPPEALRIGAAHRVRVRMRDATSRWSSWSEPVELVAGPPSVPFPQQASLRVSEVHYHPLGDRDEEFIEVLNIGAEPVDLTAVAFTEGVGFRFAEGAVKVLGPGERIVVVENLRAFRGRYGETGILVAGEYEDRLSNGGERLVLTYGLNATIQDFELDDAWYPETDGGGRSLEIADPLAPLAAWSRPDGWRPSRTAGGTPGAPGDAPPLSGRRVPGDANSNGSLEIGDAVAILWGLFVAPVPLPCGGASPAEGGDLLVLDADGSGAVDLADAVAVLSHLFRGGAPPALGAACVRIPGCSELCGP
ncbi:MAG: lamin tail domain-containing protein [Planctomycetes bacterium]|nr:lamin tail domain-containing protein [Planctomycetota bacterium]